MECYFLTFPLSLQPQMLLEMLVLGEKEQLEGDNGQLPQEVGIGGNCFPKEWLMPGVRALLENAQLSGPL